MPIPFNGVTVEFTPSGGSAISLKVRSHSESGSERPEVDVTDSLAARRQVLVGLAAPEKHGFELVAVNAAERATLSGLLDDCASGTLVVKHTPCGGSETDIINVSAWCSALSYAADLDGTYTVNIEFTRDHT